MAVSKVSPPKPATLLYTAATVLTIALGTVIGCNEGSRDRLMRFFFEVPDAAVSDGKGNMAPSTASTEASTDPNPALMASTGVDGWILHPPYEMQQCTRCHVADTGMSFDVSIDAACRQCHAPFFESTRRPHMEDLESECRACHHPHRSEESALLRIPQPDLCWECHSTDLAETPTHAAAAGQKCTQCHDVHYSDRPHNLLRDFVPMKPLADEAPVAPSDSQADRVQAGDAAERPGIEPEDFDDLREAFLAERARERGLSVAEAKAADEALSDEELPFDPDDDELIRAGAELFTINCIRCHGPSLTGDGWTEFRRRKKIDLLREVRRRGWDTSPAEKAAEIFTTISEGRVVIGDPSMPTFAAKLTKEQRWQLVIFVRSKQIEANR